MEGHTDARSTGSFIIGLLGLYPPRRSWATYGHGGSHTREKQYQLGIKVFEIGIFKRSAFLQPISI